MPTLSQQIYDGCDLSSYVVSDGLPDTTALCDFIAQRVVRDLNQRPSDIRFALASSEHGAYRLSGSVTIDDVDSPIAGTIMWLPNLSCFRGHIRIVPPPTKSDLRRQELIDMYSAASENLDADAFYAKVRVDGLTKVESLQLLKYYYGTMLNESLDLHMRYEAAQDDR